VGTFIELHVEQGRWLADADRPVALGESIIPHGRWRFDLLGQANHAGTTALVDRVDPMIDLAAVITAARSAATRHACVATVGKLEVEPNGVNAIPSLVRAWLDARGGSESDVRAVVAAVAEASGTSAREESFTPETRFDSGLSADLATLLDDAPILPTGAGHDAGVLALAGVPTAMLFVRNPTGVSHSPAERAEHTDCWAGVEALASCLTRLTGPQTADTHRLDREHP
jgi:N-carbamoyl-L-amino-acid hydrolase